MAAADGHAAVEAESCDPARHAISVSMGCAAVPQVHVDVPSYLDQRLRAASRPIRSALRFATYEFTVSLRWSCHDGSDCDPPCPERHPPQCGATGTTNTSENDHGLASST